MSSKCYYTLVCIVSNPENQSRCSIVVSIPACHAGDPGSIPGSGEKGPHFLS
ncbi:unnamed protein product [Sphagnum troendelagicum]|uniref:Uncharacterized protein n=1 Tax=Sphagnum troendelagicum TaxID=128251 RepID=A0ABP0TBB7_9BRYO